MNREKMTIDEAIAIIRKEYLCVDRDCDIERNCGKCDLMMPSKEPILEAYKMAIKALEQEPCEDAIDRKLVCAFIAGLISDDGEREKGLEYIRNMPPVNPQPCDDAISRQAVLDIVDSYSESRSNVEDVTQDMISDILALPPVTPKPKTGHWILDDDKEHGRCSECGCKEDLVDGHSNYKWCSNCGAKLIVESQESEDKTTYRNRELVNEDWIPIGNKLPDKYGIYLVTINNQYTDFCEFYPDTQLFGMNGNICNEVTAWMPLPKSYEPQERSDKE